MAEHRRDQKLEMKWRCKLTIAGGKDHPAAVNAIQWQRCNTVELCSTPHIRGLLSKVAQNTTLGAARKAFLFNRGKILLDTGKRSLEMASVFSRWC
jgi:hypothetical protein